MSFDHNKTNPPGLVDPPRARDNWHEDPEAWDVLGRISFSEQKFAQAPIEVAAVGALLARHGLDSLAGAKVLDMPCGPGRHSLPLAEVGAEVTAVDLNEAFVDELRAVSEAEGAGIAVCRSDMRTFEVEDPGSFDVGLSLFSSLGYTVDRDDDVSTLRRFAAALRPGGWLVIDTMSVEIMARVYEATRYHEVAGYTLQENSVLSDSLTRVDTRFTLRRDAETLRASFKMRLYSVGEFRLMLREAGFEPVAEYGGLDGTPFDMRASRLVLVAKRSEAA
jgi:2-polyprenyl-3-methyl-5-hydroxy-6-metoxy-1,4-benzoquinol methylase